MVPPADEHLASALRRARRVGGNVKLKNEAARARNRAARQMDELTRAISAPLNAVAKGFPAPGRLHPFEAALLELTVGADSYVKRLARVDALRRSAVEVLHPCPRPALATAVCCGCIRLEATLLTAKANDSSMACLVRLDALQRLAMEVLRQLGHVSGSCVRWQGPRGYTSAPSHWNMLPVYQAC